MCQFVKFKSRILAQESVDKCVRFTTLVLSSFEAIH
jgi:hypothetical protein